VVWPSSFEEYRQFMDLYSLSPLERKDVLIRLRNLPDGPGRDRCLRLHTALSKIRLRQLKRQWYTDHADEENEKNKQYRLLHADRLRESRSIREQIKRKEAQLRELLSDIRE